MFFKFNYALCVYKILCVTIVSIKKKGTSRKQREGRIHKYNVSFIQIPIISKLSHSCQQLSTCLSPQNTSEINADFTRVLNPLGIAVLFFLFEG